VFASSIHFIHIDGRLLGLPSNIRLGWKRMAKANSLAYYDMAKINTVKCFTVKAPGACTMKPFTAVIIAL
jgi:hypothetical protein